MKKVDVGTNNVDSKKNKGMFFKAILSFFYRSIFIPEMGHLTDMLDKALSITNDESFIGIRRKSKALHFLVFILTVTMTSVVVYSFYFDSKVISDELMRLSKIGVLVLDSLKVGNIDKAQFIIENIKLSPKAVNHFISSSVLILSVHTISFCASRAIVVLNPLIRKSNEMREAFIKRGWSTEKDTYFLVCKAGILCQPSVANGDAIVADTLFWRNLNRIPREPLECATNRTIIFIGNGFELKKMEFKA